MPKRVCMPETDPVSREIKLVEWRVKIGDELSNGDIVGVIGAQQAPFEIEACER